MNSNLTGIEIAQITAALKGAQGYKRPSSKAAAIKALANQLSSMDRSSALDEILFADNYEQARDIALGSVAPKKAVSQPVRPGSNRDKAINKLLENVNKPVLIEDLIRAVYGEEADLRKQRWPMLMVMKGVGIVIKQGKLEGELVKTRKNKETSFAIYQ